MESMHVDLILCSVSHPESLDTVAVRKCGASESQTIYQLPCGKPQTLSLAPSRVQVVGGI